MLQSDSEFFCPPHAANSEVTIAAVKIAVIILFIVSAPFRFIIPDIVSVYSISKGIVKIKYLIQRQKAPGSGSHHNPGAFCH